MKNNAVESAETLRGTFSLPKPDKGRCQIKTQLSTVEKVVKRMSITQEAPRNSLFGCHLAGIIADQQKEFNKKNDDLLNSFSDLSMRWKEIILHFTKGKPVDETIRDCIMKVSTNANLNEIYEEICLFFAKLVEKLEGDTEFQGCFSDELVFAAGLGIQHTNNLIILELVNLLANTEVAIKETQVNDCFNSLKIFHEFYFAIAKLKSNLILQEKHIILLNDTIKSTFISLQRMLKSNFKLLKDTPAQAKIIQIITHLIHSSLQTIVILTIFGELPEITKIKYNMILDRLKTIFALISQSSVFEKIFNEPLEFETTWNFYKGKYMLSSFNQKRFSLFLQEEKIGENDNIQFNLKFMLVYYNYKVLKVISQRVQISYDEHIFSMLSSLIHKNRVILHSLISQKEKRNVMKVMMLINENVCIIKSFIFSLAFFSNALDPIQRQGKYDAIKEIAMDCLTLSIKSCLCRNSDTEEEVNKLSIFTPKDFVAYLFNSLLLFKKVGIKNTTGKITQEMSKHINIIAADLVSRPVPTDDSIMYFTYRLYVLQFLKEWELDLLKDKYMKYSEEMSRCLTDSDDDELENGHVQILKNRVQDLALSLYVNLAHIDSITPIETTIDFIRESYANEIKLCKHIHILFCLLCKQIFSLEKFLEIIDGKKDSYKEVFMQVQTSKEINALIEKEGMSVLFMIYKGSISSYNQTKEMEKSFEEQILEEQKKKSIDAIETEAFVEEEYVKKLKTTIQSYENLISTTSKFICFLHYSVKIAEDFLMKPAFDTDFFELALPLPTGRALIMKMLQILSEKLLSDLKIIELVNKFASVIIDIFVNLSSKDIPYSEEKQFVLEIIILLETFITQSVKQKNRYKLYRVHCARKPKKLCFKKQF